MTGNLTGEPAGAWRGGVGAVRLPHVVRDFDVRKVIDVLGFQVEEQPFLGGVKPEPPSPKLVAALDLLRSALVLGSEKWPTT